MPVTAEDLEQEFQEEQAKRAKVRADAENRLNESVRLPRQCRWLLALGVSCAVLILVLPWPAHIIRLGNHFEEPESIDLESKTVAPQTPSADVARRTAHEAPPTPLVTEHQFSHAGNSANVQSRNNRFEEGDDESCAYIRFLSRLKPAPCIEYLGRMAQKYFHKLGNALEIFPSRNAAKHSSESWKDGWKGEFDSIVEGQVGQDLSLEGKRRVRVGNPLTLARDFKDAHYDFIFLRSGSLDSDLTVLMNTIWPKLRPFGVLSGDAYSDIEDSPFLKHERFSSVYGNGSNRVIMRTLQDFAAQHHVILHATWMKKSSSKRSSCKEKLPAWYIVKASKDADETGIPDSRSALPKCTMHVQQLSRIPPIPCRDDFRHLVQSQFNLLGRVAEIGVFQGHFTDLNLKVWQGSYYAIDAWRFRPGDPGDKNYQDSESNDRNFNIARKVMAPYNKTGRVRQIRATSEEAVRYFPDEYFDWVYVDALHTYSAAKKDMEMWWPKLRPGGFLSGDDYGENQDTEFVPSAAWKETYGPEGVDHSWGVITAAQDFARLRSAVLQVTWLAWGPRAKCYKFPAWYMVKPMK